MFFPFLYSKIKYNGKRAYFFKLLFFIINYLDTGRIL